MNRHLQNETHPDADLLSAFAEQALPEAERTLIVAHLAGCSRCREVVFLAQAAAGAVAAPAPIAAAKPDRQRGWFGARFPWRVPWIPAAALASVGAMLIWVHWRSAPPPVNEARLSAPPPAPIAAPSPGPATNAASVPRPESAARKASSESPTQKAEGTKVSKPAVTGVEETASAGTAPMLGVPEAPTPGLSGSRTGGHVITMARQAPAQAIAAPPVAPEPALANTHWQPQTAETAQQEINGGAMAVKAPPASVSPNLRVAHGAAGGSAMAGPQTVAVAGAPSMPVVPAAQPMNGLAALSLTRHPRLPSGLYAVSSATMLDRALAVDSAGALFLSRDVGKHWEAIPIQWTGKAIEVTAPLRPLITAVSASPGESGSADQSSSQAAAAPAAPAPASADAAPMARAMLFKLINDRHQTWVSVDGKVWRLQ